MAHDVNNAGVIVGTSQDSKGVARPLRLAPGGFQEVLALPAGAVCGAAVALNEDGHMVGHAKFSSNEKHGVVWWRHTGANILPAASDWQTRTLSRVTTSPIIIALLPVSKQSAASIVDARTLTLGDNVGWDVEVSTNADGTAAVPQVDSNRDGLLDLRVSFDGTEVLRNEARVAAGQVELLLNGLTKDRSAALYATGIINVQR